MKNLAAIFLSMMLFCSCSDNDPIDNSKPFQGDYSIDTYFVDSNGNDVSHQIPMQERPLQWPWEGGAPVYPQDQYQHYTIPQDEYSYDCYVDGKHIDKISITEIETPRVWLEITTNPADKRKRFTFASYLWDKIGYADAFSGRIYEFEYHFRIPALFGEQENILKIRSEACKFWDGDYESVTFNGKPITPSGNRTFEIIVD